MQNDEEMSYNSIQMNEIPFVGQVFHSLDDIMRQMTLHGWREIKRRRLGRGALLLFQGEEQEIALFAGKDLSRGVLILKVRLISFRGQIRGDWFEIVDSPELVSGIRYWDLAATVADGTNDPDYTVGCLMSRKGNVFYVRDIQRLRGSPSEVEDLVRRTAHSDGEDVTIYMEQEPGSGGVNTIDNYRRRILSEYDFHADKSSTSKEMRATPFIAQCQAGRIKLIQGDWIEDFLREIESFPYGFHDDQMDAASGAFSKLI